MPQIAADLKQEKLNPANCLINWENTFIRIFNSFLYSDIQILSVERLSILSTAFHGQVPLKFCFSAQLDAHFAFPLDHAESAKRVRTLWLDSKRECFVFANSSTNRMMAANKQSIRRL